MENFDEKPPKPDTHLVWAILTTLLCCLPFGIVSIVYAAQVDGFYANEKYEEAIRRSKLAKDWAIASAVTGGVILLVYFALLMQNPYLFNSF